MQENGKKIKGKRRKKDTITIINLVKELQMQHFLITRSLSLVGKCLRYFRFKTIMITDVVFQKQGIGSKPTCLILKGVHPNISRRKGKKNHSFRQPLLLILILMSHIPCKNTPANTDTHTHALYKHLFEAKLFSTFLDHFL